MVLRKIPGSKRDEVTGRTAFEDHHKLSASSNTRDDQIKLNEIGWGMNENREIKVLSKFFLGSRRETNHSTQASDRKIILK